MSPVGLTVGRVMAVAVAITNLDYTASDLRRLMSKERDGEVVGCLCALALVLEGHSRTLPADPERAGSPDVARLGASPQRGRHCGARFRQKHRPRAEVERCRDGSA